MRNTKRLGRYHLTANNNTDSSPSYFQQLTSLYNDNLDSDKPLLFSRRHSSLEKVFARANKKIEKSNKFINKIKSREIACSTRAKSIPENATIRKEYIKCGKRFCEEPHGPYYYAYWKDPQSKKLNKKYIGTHKPENNEKMKNQESANRAI